MSDEPGTFMNGILLGKLPGNREWVPYYLELTSKHLHIYDNNESRRCLRTLEISSSDMTGEDSKSKKEFRFYILRPGDGRYVFKCNTPRQRDEWTMCLDRVINKQGLVGIEGVDVPTADALSPDNVNSHSTMAKRFDLPKVPVSASFKSRTLPSNQLGSKLLSALDTPLPPIPPTHQFDNPRTSVISNDSGFGASEGAEFRRSHNHRSGTSSVPSSGGGTFRRPTSSSDSGKFARAQIQVDEEDDQEFDYSKCKWFWRYMSRQDCEKKLKEEGKVGNFAVRINANGNYIMSLWRADGVHHHKILQHGSIFRFERAAVSAEGESLVDLLDNYLKACVKDKKIEPFGGVLYDQYNYAWNPPDFDMNVLQERLKEQKRKREKAAKTKTPPSQRKEQYTPVELDTGSDELKSATDSENSGDGAFQFKMESQQPSTTAKPYKSQSSSTSESETTPKRKPLPPTPAKKTVDPVRNKHTSIQTKREESFSGSTQSHSLVDRMNQPLPPTPTEEPQSHSNAEQARRKFKPSTGGKATGSELIKEMVAKRGKGHLEGSEGRAAKKKQPVPVPKQRPVSKKAGPGPAPTTSTKLSSSSGPAPEQLHEPAGYANLPAHDTPYQNVGFGPDSTSAPQEEPDALYENIHKSGPKKTPKYGRVDPEVARTQKGTGYANVQMNGSGVDSEYQNVNSSRRPRPQRK